MEENDLEQKQRFAEERIRSEWDLLKKTGILCQIGCTAGPQIIERDGKKKPIYDLFKWNAIIKGPKRSPYEGFLFKFEIIYPKTYPEEPPKVFCRSNIYHMNISISGDVCVSSIKDEKDWVKAGDISNVLLSIFVLLYKKPNTISPYRKELKEEFLKNENEYYKNAREYCEKFAIKCS